MLIKELSIESKKKLSTFCFKENLDINQELQGGNALWGFYSFTPLMYAAFQGDLNLVKELVEKGADLNKKDEFFDSTALMWAASKGQNKIVEYLLKSGADATYRSNSFGKPQNAYSLSKKSSCCSVMGFWQRTKETLGLADFDNTQRLLTPFKNKI